MNLWQLLSIVVVLGAVVTWKNGARARWVQIRLAWMFGGAFVASVGMSAALEYLSPRFGVAIADMSTRAILGLGFVWAAWIAGGVLPAVYRYLRNWNALQSRFTSKRTS